MSAKEDRSALLRLELDRTCPFFYYGPDNKSVVVDADCLFVCLSSAVCCAQVVVLFFISKGEEKSRCPIYCY